MRLNPDLSWFPRPVQDEPPAAGETRLPRSAAALRIGALIAPFAALAVAVAAQLPDAVAADARAPVNMSSLRVEGLSGYPVHDAGGVRIGEVRQVETDQEGRTRYIHMALDDGRETRLAAFRAQLDTSARRIDLVMPLYAVEMTASQDPVVTVSRGDKADAQDSLAKTISLRQ